MPGANVLTDELVGLIRREILKSQSSFQPRPQRGRRPRRGKGGEGGGKRTTLVRATADIPPGTGDPRTPTLSGDYEHVKGDTLSGDIENWSQVLIDDNSYMVIVEINGDNVIVSAFC
jgi:hypothetical protein